MTKIIDSIVNIFKPKTPDQDVDVTPAEPDEDKNIPWFRVGLLARNISLPHLRAVLFTVPVIVFFALSGLLAWIVVVIKFIVTVYNLF